MSLDYNLANQDIVEETKELILSQFAESDNIQRIAEIIAEEAKSYEEVAEKVFTTYLLTEAEGYSLDAIGEFLNFPREDRDDSAYRTALIVSAIGASSSINRDSISNLVDILTNGIGGYFVQGNYHDVYVYLQDACVEREVAKDFLDRYLPANTQASILFESGTSFGFEGDDLARGFDTVRVRAAEGTSFVKYAVAEAVEYPAEMLLPNKFVFEDPLSDIPYRTDEATDLKATVRAAEWAIPTTYTQGDVLQYSVRNAVTGDYSVGAYVVQGTTDTDKEIMEFISDLILDLGAADISEVYTDNSSGYKVYLGFEPVTDGALFSGRDSVGTEYNPVLGQLITKEADEVRYVYEDDGGVATPTRVLSEMPSINYILDSTRPGHTSEWSPSSTGTVTTADVGPFVTTPSVQYNQTEFTLASIGDYVEFGQIVSVATEGRHTFSMYLKTENDPNVTVIIDGNTLVLSGDTVVSSDFPSESIESIVGASVVDKRLQIQLDVPTGATTVDISVQVEAVAADSTFTAAAAQLEPTREATSYIPTRATSLETTVERAQDFFAFTSEPNPVGFNNHHVVQVSAKDYSGFYAWGCVRMSALTKGEYPVPFATTFVPVDTADFTIYDVSTADTWTDGFGTPLFAPTESSTSAGAFCTRVSLTSTDVLGYADLSRAEYEYELDSSLSEYVGMEDYTIGGTVHKRPMQTLENYNTFSPPTWDSALVSTPEPRASGLVTRSPQAVSELADYFLAESEGIENLVQDAEDGVLIEVGDQSLPSKPYYFEVGVESLPVATSVEGLSFFFESVRITKTTASDGSIDISTYISRITVGVGALPSGDFALQQHLLQRGGGYSVDSEGEYVTKTPAIVSSTKSEEYTAASPLAPRTIGFLVNPIANTVQMFYDGATWDGSQSGYVIVDTESGSSEYTVGDVFGFGSGYTGKATIYMRGYTDSSEPEPINPEDYGSFKWIYNHNDLRYTSQLPENTVDIFGRTIVTE